MTDERSDFEHQIDCRPDFSFLTVLVPAKKTLRVEASAMATMDCNLEMKTKLKGGFGRMLTGESLFIIEFTAAGGVGVNPHAKALCGSGEGRGRGIWSMVM